jgi:gliding motility-associated-like protein
MQAQICNGSLGDPVVNITFGSGNNPGGALPAGSINNYLYTPNTCPDDGAYTIVNSTYDCFGGSWHNVSQDHTPGDVNGYMMVVNASFAPGDFYVTTVTGLCGGTTYEFASWIMNVLRTSACGGAGITPNLTFKIETQAGVVLGTYSTGYILNTSSPEWKQYGLFFTTPAAGGNIILRITNNAPGGCGNDIILDDITFRPCGPLTSAGIIGSISDTVHKCADDNTPIQIQATVGQGYNNPTYNWQVSKDNGDSFNDIPGATTTQYTHQPSGPGVFLYRLAVAEGINISQKICRIATNLITINVHDVPGAGIGSNTPVCLPDSVRLTVSAGSTFTWKGPNGFSSSLQNPTIKGALAASGTYTLQAKDSIGCVGTASTIVAVNASPMATYSPAYNTCENEPLTLTVSGGSNYLWTPAAGLSANNVSAPIATLTDSTNYKVVVSNEAGCTDTATIAVNVFKKPTANAGPDKFVVIGQSTTLEGSATGTNVKWKWTPTQNISNVNALTPAVSPTTNSTYVLNVESNAGCGIATDSVFVRVYLKVAPPTAFSPNGDGINDTWRIDALQTYPEAVMSVFNRFGQLVFTSLGYNIPWDGKMNGKPLPSDTYYYFIDLKNDLPKVQGWVFLLR